MRTASVLFVACLALLLLPARAGAAERPLAHEKYQLPNGLTVILHEDARLPQVAVNVWYHCGTREEPPGRSGFAHLFEHLMFMGTERAPGNTFDVLMERGGGSNNASTWFDRTNYYSWGPARLLPTLLWLEADRMQGLGAAMTQRKLDLQRDVVRNERREGYDNAPYGPSEYLFWQLMYPRDHPYHFHVIGSHEDLLAATVEDVVRFFDTYYVPNNATLVVAGAFDAAKVKPLVEGLFGSLPRGAEPPRRSAPPAGFERVERVTLADKVQFPRISVAWHTPAFYKPGDAEMDFAAFVLGREKNGRLFRRLVRDEQLAVEVSAGQTSLRLGSVFRIDCYVKPEADLDRVESILEEEILRLAQEGPTELELQRGRAEFERSTWSGLEALVDVADQLNHYDAYLGRPDALAWDLARYAQATPEGVRDWVQRMLRPDRRLVMRVVPARAPAPGLPGLDERPAPFEQASFVPPRPATFALPNGLRVWHVQRPGLALLEARLLLPGGARAVGLDKAGLAALAAEMLLEGAGARDAVAFADALDMVGASLRVRAGAETTELALSGLTRHADTSLALLASAVRAPRLDAAGLEHQRGLLLDRLQQVLDEPTELARRLGPQVVLGAPGAPVAGFPASMASLSLEDVRAHHDRFHGPENAVLLVACDLGPDGVRTLVQKHFGDWRPARPGAPPRAHPVAPVLAEGPLQVVGVERPGATQTVVRFVHPGLPFAAPERVPLQVLNTLFGGSFTSRLNANLRERHGYTYGAGSAFTFASDHGLFVASANVQSDKTGDSLREFLAEFARAREGGITAEEALKARETLASEAVQAFQSLAGTLEAYAGYARHGMEPEGLLSALATGAAQEPRALDVLARRFLARPGGVLVLVGDRAAIEPQLKGLGLPEARWLSAPEALAGRLAR